MRGRFGAVTPPALLALAVAALVPGLARAHRLVVDYRVQGDGTVRVEGWYNSPINPHPARLANVRVTRGDGSVVAEGELDERGFFSFSPARAETLTVVLSQTGHRDEIVIPASALAAQAGQGGRERSGSSERLRVAIGVALIFGVAAVFFAVRKLAARSVREEIQSEGQP